MLVRADVYHHAFDGLGSLGRLVYVDGFPFQDDYDGMRVGSPEGLAWSGAVAKAVKDFLLNPYQKQLLNSGGWMIESAVCFPELNALTEGTHPGAVPYSSDPATRVQQETQRQQAYSKCMASPAARRYNPSYIVNQIRAAGDVRKFTGDAGVAFATPAQVAAANANLPVTTPPVQTSAPDPVPLSSSAPAAPPANAPAPGSGSGPVAAAQEVLARSVEIPGVGGVPLWLIGGAALAGLALFSFGGRR